MGKKLAASDHPTEDLCATVSQIVEEAIKLRKAVERKGPDSLDDKFQKKKESRILEILDPQDTEEGLRQIWNYPVLTENYDRFQNLIAQCPYVLLGALETDLANVELNRPTQQWLFELFRKNYPEMLKVTQDGHACLYLPYTVNIREGTLIPLAGQGPYTAKTIASLGQRLVKALVIKGDRVKVYITTDNSGNDMPEFNWLTGLKDCLEYQSVSVAQAERVIRDFLDGRENPGSTVVLTQGAIRGNDIYRNLKNSRKLSRSGNNLYVAACFNDIGETEDFRLYDQYFWVRCRLLSDMSEKNFLTDRLVPFRIDRKI